jgi:UDP-glucuronate 4-epimerase
VNYIVTGAAGFIGFFTVKKLLEKGHRVLGIDSVNDYYDTALKRARLNLLGIVGDAIAAGSALYPRFRFIKLRVEDREKTMAACDAFVNECSGLDGIIHLAAQAGVQYSIENPGAYIDANILGFFNILEYCRKIRVPHFVYASSSSIYGLNEKRPFSSHDGADHPVSLYAATKRSNELMAHAYSHLYGLPATGLRFFTVYGPWGRPDMAYFKFSKAIMEGRTITVYNNGEMTRDFTYIDDIVEGILLALDHPPSPSPDFDPLRPDPSSSAAPWKIYNLGNSRAERIGFFIETLEKHLGKKAVKNYLPAPKGDVAATEADIEDAKRDLGWRPHTGIEEGLKQFAAWFLDYSRNIKNGK